MLASPGSCKRRFIEHRSHLINRPAAQGKSVSPALGRVSSVVVFRFRVYEMACSKLQLRYQAKKRGQRLNNLERGPPGGKVYVTRYNEYTLHGPPLTDQYLFPASAYTSYVIRLLNEQSYLETSTAFLTIVSLCTARSALISSPPASQSGPRAIRDDISPRRLSSTALKNRR